ncbi:hypothetical protein NITHO_2400012 [Nitrolancea hollandica Lb]|uniref:Uncharacterized protein n=1 Tax=Nitrolancea hollandica Lb TaxID=1129897 RepID=I4EFU0_9BACT|nr:hypothetical protein NITHO_2400012 [Nitrolancea hollandica Lb]
MAMVTRSRGVLEHTHARHSLEGLHAAQFRGCFAGPLPPYGLMGQAVAISSTGHVKRR